MSEMIQVLDSQVEKLEYKGKPVITLKQVDELHRKQPGTARQSFNRHRQYIAAGRDFHSLPYNERAAMNPTNCHVQNGGRRGEMIFLTERGYLKVIRAFNDPRSWELYDVMIDAYFLVRAAAAEAAMGADAASGDTLNIPKNRYVELLEAENRLLKGAAAKPKRKAGTPITNELVVKVYDMHREGMSQQGIARELGVSSAVVSFVIRFRPVIPLEH